MGDQVLIDMYKIKPLYDSDHQIPLPSCMYKMESIYSVTKSVETMEPESDSSLQDIQNSQLQLLEKLENLKVDVLNYKKELTDVKCHNNISFKGEKSNVKIEVPVRYEDIVIKANPTQPPLSIWAFYNLLAERAPTELATFIHSSLTEFPEIVSQLSQGKDDAGSPLALTFTIIWKKMEKDAEMMIDPINQGTIAGEVNIARYIARLLSFGYDDEPYVAAEIDFWLELMHSALIHGSNKDRNMAFKAMNSQLGKNSFLAGNELSIADIVLWSAIIQCDLHQSLPNNIGKWWNLISGLQMFQIPLKLN